MRFKIYRTDEEYKSNHSSPCENAIKVIKEFPEFKWIKDENNKWIEFETGKTITKSYWEVEVNTFEDFIALQKEVKNRLIFFGDGELEIYDDYRE